jgi:hypothetical protein
MRGVLLASLHCPNRALKSPIRVTLWCSVCAMTSACRAVRNSVCLSCEFIMLYWAYTKPMQRSLSLTHASGIFGLKPNIWHALAMERLMKRRAPFPGVFVLPCRVKQACEGSRNGLAASLFLVSQTATMSWDARN